MTTIARRLSISFIAILSVFAGSVALTYVALGQIANVEREVARIDRLGHTSESVVAEFHRQALLQAHALLTFDSAHLDAYLAAHERVEQATQRLRAVAEGEELTFAERIADLIAHIDDTGDELQAVVRVRDSRRANELATKTEKLVDDVVELSGQLDRTFASRRDVVLAHASQLRARTIWLVTSSLVLAFIIAAVVGVLLTRSIVKPIDGLYLGAKKIAAGDLAARVSIRGQGELAELATMFNAMTESLKRHQDELVRSQKLAAVGQLAAAVAHEINNPLSVILGYAKMLRRTPDRVDAAKLQAVEEEAVQCMRIVQDLLDLVRPTVLQVSEVDIAALVRVELERLALVLEDRSVKGPGSDLSIIVDADAGKLRQVIANLVRNAADATPRGGEIDIDVRLEDGGAAVEVRDNGSGISVDALPRVFQPFFTTKTHGTGLGLPIAQAIIDAHGGKLEISSSPGQSTRVRVWLPRARVAKAGTDA